MESNDFNLWVPSRKPQSGIWNLESTDLDLWVSIDLDLWVLSRKPQAGVRKLESIDLDLWVLSRIRTMSVRWLFASGTRISACICHLSCY